jgi:hypothetical protein
LFGKVGPNVSSVKAGQYRRKTFRQITIVTNALEFFNMLARSDFLVRPTPQFWQEILACSDQRKKIELTLA